MTFPESTLKGIEEASREEHLPIIGRKKAEYLFGFLEENRPRRPLEVGVMVGYATAVIASALTDDSRLVGIEISAALAERAVANLAAAGLSERVRILRGDAREELEALGKGFDFVFLDGQKSNNLGLLRKLEKKLVPGATVMANGSVRNHPELGPYLEYLNGSPRWRTRSQPIGDDGVEVSRFLG